MTLSFLCLPSPQAAAAVDIPSGMTLLRTPASLHSCMGSEPCGDRALATQQQKADSSPSAHFLLKYSLMFGVFFFRFGLSGEMRRHHTANPHAVQKEKASGRIQEVPTFGCGVCSTYNQGRHFSMV